MSSANNSPLSHADGAWLNRLPNRWDVVRLKFAVRVRSVKRNVVPEDRYIGLEHVESWTGRLQNSEDSSANTEGLGVVFEAGDVLFGKLRPYLAKVFLADRPGIASTEFLALQGVRVEAGFLRYCLVSEPFIGAVVAATYGAKMPRANWEDIGNLPQVVPPRQEQRAIADFLDRETAKIDALIAAQERLIALLDEKRQATITHAVTKGLDPNAPMKESGVEWLGKVPAQWNIRPLRYVARFTAGAGFPDAEQGLASEELPFFKVKDLSSGVTTGKLYETDNTISRNTACRLHAKIFPEGTIVFAKIGAALLLNRFRIVGCNCCIDNNMMGMQCIPRVITPWFARMVMSLLDMRLLVNPGAVPSLSEGNLSSLKVAIPPLDEQRTIEEQLDYVLAKISHLRNRSETVIERLRERRTALITAAVTGQIDVTRQAITETAK